MYLYQYTTNVPISVYDNVPISVYTTNVPISVYAKGWKQFHGANLTFSSNVDQDT